MSRVMGGVSMSLPYMAFYPSNFLKKTLHLCPKQAGAYLFLICHYWEHGGLPSNASALARIARLSLEEWSEHATVLQEFFYDGWRHERIDEELAIAKERHEKRVNAGRKGGLSKSSNATARLEHCSSNQNQNHKERTIVRLEHPDFDAFYAAYPKRQSRKTAAKAYAKARADGVSHETIMLGLAKALQSDSRFRDIQFTPLPASWLNAGGWADESGDRSTKSMGIV